MLAPWKESCDKTRQHIKEQRHHFTDKGAYSKSYGFSNCESWTIKKAECWRITTFELWWWRLLTVPGTARSNQWILKEINIEYSLEGLMLKLYLQYFGHLMRELTHLKRPWCLERWKAKGEGGGRTWDGYIASLIQWTWIWANSRRYWSTEETWVVQSMRSMSSQRVRHDLVTEQQQSYEAKEKTLSSFLLVIILLHLKNTSNNPDALTYFIKLDFFINMMKLAKEDIITSKRLSKILKLW